MQKNETIVIRVPEKIKNELEKRAKENYRTISQEVRMIIEKEINKNKEA